MQRSKLVRQGVQFLFHGLREFRKIVPEKGNVVVDLVQAIFDKFKSRNDTGHGRRRFLIWRLDGRKWDEIRNKNFVLVHGNLLVWNGIIFHQRRSNKFVDLVGNRIKIPGLRNRNWMWRLEHSHILGILSVVEKYLTQCGHGK